MSSTIEWTDETWNPTTGCDRISPGCDHCYALTMAGRLKLMGQAKYQADGDPRTSGLGFALTVHPDALKVPLRWKKPRTVFVNSMSDLFHKDVPETFIRDVWETMARCPQHTFQVLTKRPQRMAAHLEARRVGWETFELTPLPNVWLGTSIENDRYTFRADHLRATPAAVRFLSCEPLLGPLPSLNLDGIDWVIVGGESGPGARPMHPDWVRDIRDQCWAQGSGVCPTCEGSGSVEVDPGGFGACPDCYSETYGGTGRKPVRFFFKQWGAWAPAPWKPRRNRHEPLADYKRRAEAEGATHSLGRDGHLRELDHAPWSLERTTPGDGTWTVGVRLAGKKAAGRVLDGRTWDEMPAVTHG